MRRLRRTRVERPLLFSFLVIALLALAFFYIAAEVREGDTLAIDRQLMLMLRRPDDFAVPIGPTWLRLAMLDFTTIGNTSVLALLVTLVAGFLIMVRRYAAAGYVVAAIVSGALLSVLLKAVFERQRPALVTHLVAVDTTSFPSGHAMNSAIVYLTLGALLAGTEGKRLVRGYIMGTAIALTLIVGISRVYVGVHWPSDVLAGWCVGVAWAGLCAALSKALARSPVTCFQGPDRMGQPPQSAG